MNPRISIITCSYNQGQFIERTIQSVLSQNYNNLEHIIVDGMSTDETLTILKKYPHLKIIREPDHGQADAINKGFALATGDIISFLNSDDTLAPGTLDTVAKEINPASGRHIIMGRCQFIDENDRFTGIEHPSAFINHKRVLEIWKGYFIPQPAVFWSREVLTRCGHLDTKEHWVLDYDLFCRYSKHYVMHSIDQVFANYRLHAFSKTESLSDLERLNYSISVSQRYWGSKRTLFYWQLWFSLNHYRRKTQARLILRTVKNEWQKQPLRSLIKGFYGALIGFDVLVHRWLSRIKKSDLQQELWLKRYPQIKAYLQYKNKWEDHWVGPNLCLQYEAKTPCTQLKIQGKMTKPLHSLSLAFYIDRKLIAKKQIKSQNNFELEVALPSIYPPKKYDIQISADPWFIMHAYTHNEDFRPLSWKIFTMTMT